MFYLWLKAIHVIAVIAWMAGLLYLPRLYVYHTETKPSGKRDEMLQTMELRLLRIITTPAMLVALASGLWLLVLDPSLLQMGWMHAKLTLVVLMLAVHGWFARLRKNLIWESHTLEFRHGALYYRVWNEVPTLLMIGIVILVIVRPF